MSELEDFLADMLPRQIAAEEALHNGDVEPRLQLWSRKDPVTLAGAAGMTRSGWDEVSDTFREVAAQFSNCQVYRFELVAASVSGDLAYTFGYEYTEVSRNGGPVKPNELRVTHTYRREDGDWRIVHRHADGR